MKLINKSLSSVVIMINLLLASIVVVFITKINSVYRIYEFKLQKLKLQNLEELHKELVVYSEEFEKNHNATVALYIKDLKTQYTIKIKANEKFPAASVIKIPIMAAVYYIADQGWLSLDETLVYQKRHHCGGAGIIKRLPYGRKFKIRELIQLMISISDNVATHMLIDRIGLERLNRIFKKLGLKHTVLNRYVMDLRSRLYGIENYTSAEDIGELLEKIYKGTLVSKKASAEMLWYLLQQKISDRIPKKLPAQAVVAHKTGLMRDLCHDAGIVYTRNGDFIICVLTKTTNKSAAKNFISEIALKIYRVYDPVVEQVSNNNKNGKVVNDHPNNTFGDYPRNY